MPSRRRVGLAAALVSSTVIVTALPAVVAHADAEFLYVDNAAKACSDDGPGTDMHHPFCSIQAAADAAQPGQTVRIGGFEYTEQVTLKQSGTPGHPITFRGETTIPGHRSGIEFKPGGYPSTTNSQHAFVASGVHDITIENLWITDSPQEAVLIADSQRITLDANQVDSAGYQATTPPPKNFDNNASAIRLTGKTSDVTISRNQIGNSGRAGVAVEPGVTGTVITTNSFTGIYDFRASNVIVADSAPGTVVNSNTIGGTCGTGIVLNGGSTGSTVVNNIVQVHRNCDVNVGVGVMVAPGSVPGTRSDYNVLYSDSPDAHAYYWNGTLYRAPADLAAATGQGRHDLAADPKLSVHNAVNEDVTPGADSPAIDSADATAPGRLDTDVYGNPRADDPLVPDTGTGVGYHDRGAAEVENPFAVSLYPGTYMPDQPMAVTFYGGTTSPWYTTTTTLDFGDGSPVATAPTFPLTHTYPAAGRYIATLTATDSTGTVKKATTNADVASGPITAAVQVQQSPLTPKSVSVAGTYNSPWPVEQYQIDFGDNQGQGYWKQSLPAAPVPHDYAKPGRYTVRLTVSDDHGRSATAAGFAHINVPDPGDRAIAGRWTTGMPAANGLFNNGTWALRSTGDCCRATITQASFGQAGDLPATADWDGLGHDQLGIYRGGTFALRHDDGTVSAIPFGDTGDIPVPGYWDGNGHAQLGLYRPSIATFIVRHDDGTITTAAFGQAGDIPVAGDWDATGHFQLGIYRSGTFALRHDDGTVSTAAWGNPGDQPVVGDWYGKGRTTYGIFRPTDPSYALSGAYAGVYGYAGQVY
ncbi:PKD domain-containing protein [Streptomyces sp. SP17BM10]|uniref:PKD domain-containing protein n=1 Tax=Streptomyces sp. SP17BM10 TaxID=3002530 RepID=UPI002E79CD9F|nr:PKD domain-containing protein [Streptomyces sp. SP17BM10]MEE1789108.1 PKD domain-containing protein [Streptomyces sp. SP17BM10]